MIMRKYEEHILRINFYSGEEILVKVGYPFDDHVREWSGRIEVFEVDKDEKLIGCKLDSDSRILCGITWLKMKTRI